MRSWFWLLCAVAACGEVVEAVWVQFNGDNDIVQVDVTAEGSTPGPAIEQDLLSTTGGSVIGAVTVDPGSGPVGTLHRVEVRLDKAYGPSVQRATVTFDAGDRGSETFEMVQDSADVSLWVLELRTYGTPDEQRSDTMTVELFELDTTGLLEIEDPES